MLLNFVKLGGLQLSGKTSSWVEIFLGGNFPGGNYPGWEFSGWELSGWELFWVGIFRVGVILSGNFLWWEFSGWELSSGNHPGSSFPGGSFYVTQLILNNSK